MRRYAVTFTIAGALAVALSQLWAHLLSDDLAAGVSLIVGVLLGSVAFGVGNEWNAEARWRRYEREVLEPKRSRPTGA